MESVNLEFSSSHGKIECTRTDQKLSSLPEVSTGGDPSKLGNHTEIGFVQTFLCVETFLCVLAFV